MADTGATSGPGRPLPAWLTAWLKRRGPLSPPLTLAYRQIFILPSLFGGMLGVLMATMLIGSLNFNNNLGLLTTFTVAGLGLVSLFQAYRNLADVEVIDVQARPAFAGDALQVIVTLREPGLRDRNGIRLSLAGSSQCIDLPAGQSRTLRLEQSTRVRGWQSLSRLRVSTRHPLGLFEAWSWLMPETRGLVYPAPLRPVPPWPTAGGDSGRNSRRHEGEDFHSLREWRPGDPIHRIAWKASQRHGNLLSRQFQVETDDALVLRMTDAPGADTETRVSALAAWVVEAHRLGKRWSLSLPGRQIETGAGDDHRHDCLQALAEWS